MTLSERERAEIRAAAHAAEAEAPPLTPEQIATLNALTRPSRAAIADRNR